MSRLRELDYESSVRSDKNLNSEKDNIHNLLQDFEIKYRKKKEEMKILDTELMRFETIEQNKLELGGTNGSTFDRKGESSENVFRSNYMDKQTRSTNYTKSDFNFDRKAKTSDQKFGNEEHQSKKHSKRQDI